MTVTSLRKYKIGDRAWVDAPSPVGGIPDERTLGLITSVAGHAMCVTCHCTPPDAGHDDDASECCPGPWYYIRFTCARPCLSAAHEHLMTFAEHEMTAA